MEAIIAFLAEYGKDILQLIALSIAIISEFKEKIRSKKQLRIAIILLLIGSYFLQNISNRKDDSDKIKQYRSIIQKGDTTIKKLDTILDTIKTVQNNMSKQLSIQEFLTKKADLLSIQNQKITTKQQNVYANTDRIMNPIFPMYVTVSFVVPFEEKSLEELNRYVVTNRNKLQEIRQLNNSEGRNIIYIDTPKSQLPASVWDDAYQFSENSLWFIKDKDVKNGFNKKFTLKLNVFDEARIASELIVVDFDKREYLVTVVTKETVSVNDNVNTVFSMPGGFGFHDLLNSDVQWLNADLVNYRLLFIGLQSGTSLIKTCNIFFGECDLMSVKPRKKYRHRIVTSDFMNKRSFNSYSF